MGLNGKEKYERLLAFLKSVEKIKTILRHAWTTSGRQESVGEHCWRFALLGLVLKDEFPDVDINRVIHMALVHDLGEIHAGDVPAWKGKEYRNAVRSKHEEEGIKEIVGVLEPSVGEYILSLWREFEARETKEAKLAVALDKLEAIIQHNEGDISTWSEEEFDFQFVYGKKEIAFSEFLCELREVIDEQSRAKIASEKKS